MQRKAKIQSYRWLFALGQSASILLVAVAIGLTVNYARPGRLPLVGDWSPKAQLTVKDTGEGLSISIEDAEALFLSQGAVFMDARPEGSYRLGHIQGARSLPWADFDNRFAEVTADLSPDAVVITYCDGEACSLSKDLAYALLEKGFVNVKVLLNGWALWQQNNLPIEN